MSTFRPGPKSFGEAAKLNQMEQDVENLSRMMGETPIQVDLTGGGPPIIRLRDSGNLPVLISGFTSGTISGTLIYSWYEQTFDSSGIRVPKPNGSSGNATNNPLFEVNNTDLSSVLTGGATIQTWATRRGLCEGFGTAYEFQYQLVSGTGGTSTNYINAQGPASGSLTVTTFSGMALLAVSSGGGLNSLYLTSGSSGTVIVDIYTASLTTFGIVTTQGQSFAGRKLFQDLAIFYGDGLIATHHYVGALSGALGADQTYDFSFTSSGHSSGIGASGTPVGIISKSFLAYADPGGVFMLDSTINLNKNLKYAINQNGTKYMGAAGTFTTADGQDVEVKGGIISFLSSGTG